MKRPVRALAALVAVVGLAGCGGASASPRAVRTAAPAPLLSAPLLSAPAPSTAALASTPAPVRPSRAPAASTIVSSPTALGPTTAAATATTTVPRAVSPADHLVGVGSATQVISVIAEGYGSSYATVTAYQKSATGWRRVLGPWSARIGRNGFAPPGSKREGDGRTPSGSYGFSFFFGVAAPPSGLRYGWRHAASYDVWDDDPASARYNLWTDTRTQDAGRSPESMAQVPAYDYAAVIAYNTARKPGLGSAIFFHVAHGSATAGCVSVPAADVVAVLRWLDPARHPRIVMGTRATVTR